METKSSSEKKILNVQIGKTFYIDVHRENSTFIDAHIFSAFRPFFLFPLLDNQCVVRKLNVYDYGIRWTTQCDFSYLAIEELLVYLNVSNVNLKTNVKNTLSLFICSKFILKKVLLCLISWSDKRIKIYLISIYRVKTNDHFHKN